MLWSSPALPPTPLASCLLHRAWVLVVPEAVATELQAQRHPAALVPAPTHLGPAAVCLSLQAVEAVAEELQAQGLVKLVVDPVLVSTSGDALATAGRQ